MSRRSRKLWSRLESPTAAVEPEVASPCTGNCALDPSGLCVRCGRTLAEIAGWLAATNAEKAAIVRAAQDRRTA